MLRFPDRFLASAIFAAVLIAGNASLASAQTVPTGILLAANTEMDGYAKGNLAEFLRPFIAQPLLIDDASPFFMQGCSAVRTWFLTTRPSLGKVTLQHDPATDFGVQGTSAYAAFPFTITVANQYGRYIGHGVWTGVFVQEDNGLWKIRSLTIALLSFAPA